MLTLKQLKSIECSFLANSAVPSMPRTETSYTALCTLPLTISKAEAPILLRLSNQLERSCVKSGLIHGGMLFQFTVYFNRHLCTLCFYRGGHILTMWFLLGTVLQALSIHSAHTSILSKFTFLFFIPLIVWASCWIFLSPLFVVCHETPLVCCGGLGSVNA